VRLLQNDNNSLYADVEIKREDISKKCSKRLFHVAYEHKFRTCITDIKSIKYELNFVPEITVNRMLADLVINLSLNLLSPLALKQRQYMELRIYKRMDGS
jgi:hypothetical protein